MGNKRRKGKNKNKGPRKPPGVKRAEKVKKREERKAAELVDSKIIHLGQSEMEQVALLPAMPRILGADFVAADNDIDLIQQKIDALAGKQPEGYKKRILFISEASYLHTGFSTYMREVLKRLHKTGKYEIAEFGSYGHSPDQDPRAKQIPWKYYHNLPKDGIEMAEYGQPNQPQYRENQFGKWKLSYVLADWKPDFVLLHRDNWMDTHVLKNEFRGNFKVFWMACVDGYPQKWAWIHDYTQVDRLLAYSYFGKRVMEEQSRTPLAKRIGIPGECNVWGVAQPGVNTDIFRPMPRNEVFGVFGIQDQNLRFVGTVMRNQPRKLFTRILEAFRMFCEQHPEIAKNVLLLLHTGIPDVGWDIPEVIRQNGLDNKVVFSYICEKCNQIAISTFLGSPTDCFMCKGRGCLHTPNTQYGFDETQFNYIYNCLDLYLQLSIAEGDGMPMNEAKACGVPVLASDYSAMAEKARNGGALPIRNETIYTEHETHQFRSLFDRQDLVDNMAHVLGNEGVRRKLAGEARQCAEKFYNWDLTAKKWELVIDETEIKDRSKHWDAPIEMKVITDESPEETLSDEEFVVWCYKNIVSGKDPDAEGFRTWTQTLKNAGPPGSPGNSAQREKLEKFFRDKVATENAAKEIRANPEKATISPTARVEQVLNKDDKFRILYVIPETAGDVLISTGVIEALARKWKKKSPAIYVATKKEFANILKDNPHVAGVVEPHDSMYNYRAFETWGPQKNLFDIVFTPAIVTQKIPHWIHNGYGDWLGKTYANMCSVKFGKTFLAEEPLEGIELPEEFITVHSQTRQDPKDYDHLPEVVARIKDIPIVQIGGAKDKKVNRENVIDLRGKTTPQQLAWVLRKAKMHLGQDSFPMHVAGHVGTDCVIVFGGTYWQQGVNPDWKHIRCIETQDRGPCVTSCHLINCEAKKMGYDKCINNIPVEDILAKVGEIIGEDRIIPPEPITLSAYLIVRNAVDYKYPIGDAIECASKIVDEVVVVDGGSQDGTYEGLLEMAQSNPKLKVHQHIWDLNNPTLFGDEKTYARNLCTGSHLIQLDSDEMIVEPTPGATKELIRKQRFTHVVDLPCINFYGDDETIRIEESFWKWRISRADANVIHGVHQQARIFDQSTGRITMDKRVSDGCEYVYADTLAIAQHRPGFDAKILDTHGRRAHNMLDDKEYLEKLQECIKAGPVVFHYSWMDLDRKKKGGSFWDQTWHGQRNATHNTTRDIAARIELRHNEVLVHAPELEHPLKGKHPRKTVEEQKAEAEKLSSAGNVSDAFAEIQCVNFGSPIELPQPENKKDETEDERRPTEVVEPAQESAT